MLIQLCKFISGQYILQISEISNKSPVSRKTCVLTIACGKGTSIHFQTHVAR